MKRELQIGLLLFGVVMVLKQFMPVPEWVSGILLSLALCLDLVGSLSDEHYERLKQAKKRMISRFIK